MECSICSACCESAAAKTLVCGHTFCENCICKLIHNQTLVCPKCPDSQEMSTSNYLNTSSNALSAAEKKRNGSRIHRQHLPSYQSIYPKSICSEEKELARHRKSQSVCLDALSIEEKLDRKMLENVYNACSNNTKILNIQNEKADVSYNRICNRIKKARAKAKEALFSTLQFKKAQVEKIKHHLTTLQRQFNSEKQILYNLQDKSFVHNYELIKSLANSISSELPGMQLPSQRVIFKPLLGIMDITGIYSRKMRRKSSGIDQNS